MTVRSDGLARRKAERIMKRIKNQELLEAYRSLAKAADAMRPSMDLLGTRTYQHAIAYDAARATVANLEGEGREG